MNICFVHEEYPEETNFGGIATYQKIMAEELVKQGNKVFVICRGLSENKEYIENGVKVFRIFVPKTKNQLKDYIRYRKRVAEILNSLQENKLIDIIEVPDWGAETIYFEKKRKVPLVVRLHTPLKVWLKYNKNDFGRVKDLLLKWEEKMLKTANLVTCCSEILKKVIVKDFKISDSQIIVIPNPINTSDFFRDNLIKKENKLIFVGSLEERKGLCVLAKALNIVFDNYPNLKIEFIGKDTKRNSQNISTQKLIYNTVNEKYHNNLVFVGHVPNKDLNKYLNSSRIGVFPSLFDNFPYVVLESMLIGLHIVGSSNSGMVEMLNDNTSIYETGNYKDLANKIIRKYKLSLKQKISKNNIDRATTMYNPIKVCNEMKKLYTNTIKTYNAYDVTLDELQIVLNNICSDKILSFKRENGGVANLVFRVITKNKKYIIKKYLYNYDFSLSNELYKKYEDANIQHLKPINNKIILYKLYNYNIFEYMKNNKVYKIKIKDFENILCCDRKTTMTPSLITKCQKYYTFLKKCNFFEGIKKEDVKFVINNYNKLKKIKILNEQYLNHGDLSKSNILNVKNNKYIIDFDEVIVTTPLYDFAVVVIKNFCKNGILSLTKYNKLKKEIKKKLPEYKDIDFKNITKFYLCKILVEKFYLHQKAIINLNSKEQKRDNYKKYLKLLKKFEKIC